MSQINTALTTAEHRIENLSGDRPGDRPHVSEIISLAQWHQVQATLLLAQQVERIADVLAAAADGTNKYGWLYVRTQSSDE